MAASSSAAASASLLDVIKHYQRNIERCQKDEARLLHCINKLYRLPVKVEHLQETGIGKTVNSLRKFNGEIGVAAKALVTKWKAMVAAEEEPIANTNSNHDEEPSASNGKGSSDEERGQDSNRPRVRSNESKGGEHSQEAQQQKSDRHSSHDKDKPRGHREQKERGESSGKRTDSSASRSKNAGAREHSHHKQHDSSASRKTGDRETSAHHHHRSHKNEVGEKSECERKDNEHRSHSRHEKERSEKRTDGVSRDERKASSSSSQHKGSSSRSEKHKSAAEGEHRHHSGREKSESGNKHKDKEREKQEERRSKHDHHKSEESSSKTKEQRDRQQQSSSTAHAATVKPAKTTSIAEFALETMKSPNSAAHSTTATASTSSAERKRRQNSDSDSADSKATPRDNKLAKIQTVANKRKNNADEADADDDNDGIDSSTGANFADVLGMLNMPTKKHKKSQPAHKSKESKESPHKSISKLNGLKSSSVFASTSKASTSASARRSPDAPDLLSSSAKLEPLDPNIALELPTISNNYKPLPLNQTVMDCVFNTCNSSASKQSMNAFSEAEALSLGISSKTMRTKIYSGVRPGQILQVPSLFDLCIRVLQKNIDALEYTGGVPYDVLKPILERMNPQQLLIFEEYNPYLMEDSDTLWRMHVQRNYRTQKRQEMESWREMYMRCQEDQERKLSILAESIKQSQKVIAAPVRKTQLAFVDSLVKPPRNVLRKQEQFGTRAKAVATPAARVAALASATPNAARTGDARLRVDPTVRDNAQVSHGMSRPKKAPLMAKTLQFMRSAHKR